MLYFSSRLAGAACGLLLAAPFVSAHAQAPYLSNVAPTANALNVPRTASVVATFNRPLTAASGGALKVYSLQRGGLRGGGAAIRAGSTLTFAPTAYDFRPGETVNYTVTSAGGTTGTPRVGQFVAAAGGTGRGQFGPGFGLPLAVQPVALAVGDLNGDGVPDVATANSLANSVSLRLSVQYQAYAAEATVTVGQSPRGVALADVDGDGDLDLLAVNNVSNTVSVRLNNGLGTFSGTQAVGTDLNPTALAVGDMDGDGDLDVMVAATGTGYGSTLSCLLNNGTGLFTAAPIFRTGTNPVAIALGDIDNDGDLDVATACPGTGAVTIHFNYGPADFIYSQSTSSGANPLGVVLADMNSDGLLDLVVLNVGSGAVSVVFNDTSGRFYSGSNYGLGAGLAAMALGDMDADGDLDLLATGQNGRLTALRNNGAGSLAAAGTTSIPTDAQAMTLVDMDGDSDLDCVVADYNAALNTYFNGGTGPLATAPAVVPDGLGVYPNPATGRVQLRLPPAATRAELLDALGRTVQAVPAQAGNATLDVTGLAAGFYVVRAAGQVSRLVVE